MTMTDTFAGPSPATDVTTTHYKGVAPLTIVRIGTPPASMVYVYEDQIVPADANPADLTRLVEEGFLAEVELAVDVAQVGLTPEQAAEYADYVQAQHERISTLEQQLADLTARLEAAADPSAGSTGQSGTGTAKKTAQQKP